MSCVNIDCRHGFGASQKQDSSYASCFKSEMRILNFKHCHIYEFRDTPSCVFF